MSALSLLLVLIAGQASAPPPAGPPIRNFLRESSDFCTGGQPRLEDFPRLKAEGVRTVLNLRTAAEYRGDFQIGDEEKAAKAAGLEYLNIPVVYTAPTDANADEFLKITDDPAARPMFIHCTAAIRAGAFWLIRRVLRDHWTWDAALDEAHKVGLVGAPHLEAFAKAYIDSHQTAAAPAWPPEPAAGRGEWTGTIVTGLIAVGGETTGIAIDTDRGRLELSAEPALRATLVSLKGQKITIRGMLANRPGVEIPMRHIVTVAEVVRKPAMP